MFRRNRESRQSLQNQHTEDFRIGIDIIFRDFLADPDATEYAFPVNLSNVERKYIHERCRKLGVKSRSKGKEPNRYLTMHKSVRSEGSAFELNMCNEAFDAMNTYISRNFNAVTPNFNNMHETIQNDITMGRLNFGKLIDVKVCDGAREFEGFRKELPVFTQREVILETIRHNRVTIISGETGSGKTTQIPQYILEDCAAQGKPCRIICTQPRRISTVAVAERVASERGEPLGGTCGYQIKLESKIGTSTALVYCTTGVLLRTLMGGSAILSNISHIIIDEIHERDKFTDFVMISLREYLKSHPELRLILMSATLDVELFERYFEDVAQINVRGRTYPIKQYFLEHILAELNYESESMKLLGMKNDDRRVEDVQKPVPLVDEGLLREMDEALVNCMAEGSEENFIQIMHLILTDSVPVEHREMMNGYTPLIVAAANGNLSYVEQLLHLGADVSQTTPDGRTAYDWAMGNNFPQLAETIRDFDLMNKVNNKDLLSLYTQTTLEDMIDYDLILAIITYIHTTTNDNMGVLVFLPGYDDIIGLFEFLSNSPLASFLKICMLHGSMMINAQHEVFRRSQKRKVILSTNVAETSITIDDIAYVINSGRVKQKSYDSLSGTSTLDTQWTSMASAHQRAGRAGRCAPGKCFHLFSSTRYNALLLNSIPEILTVPLHELCLQTKLLAPRDMSIADFLGNALEAPSGGAIEKAISGLVSLGALDREENLTVLGSHLLKLCIEPHLGKMLLYSVILKCLDPVLTIVATLAHKEPFVLPCKGVEKLEASQLKKSLSFGTLSDHMTLLMAFQKWQAAKVKNGEYRFCKEFYISSGCMEMITVTRNHIVTQLRATGFLSHSKEVLEDATQYCESWPMVKAALAAGLYPNVAFSKDNKICSRLENRVLMHSSSCLRGTHEGASGLWFIYEEMSKAGSLCNLKCVTAVTPATIVLMAGSFIEFDQESGYIKIDDLLHVHVRSLNIWKFRLAIDGLIQKRINKPSYRCTKPDDMILETLQSVLSAEDSSNNLTHPAGIGTKPLGLHKRNVQGIPPRQLVDGENRQQNQRQNQQNQRQNQQNRNNWQSRTGQNWNQDRNQERYQDRNQDQGRRDNFRENRGNRGSHRNGFTNGPVNRGYYDNSSSSSSFTSESHYSNGPSQSNGPFNGYTNGPFNHNGPSLYSNYGGPSKADAFYNGPVNGPVNGPGNGPINGPMNGYGNGYPSNPSNPGFDSDSVEGVLASSTSSVSINSDADYHERFGITSDHVLINAIAAKDVVISPNAKFFVVRPGETKNIMISISQSTWTFAPQTEKKVFRSFLDGCEVYLLFSVRGTSVFHAVAKLLGTNDGVPSVASPIEWLGTRSVGFDRTLHFIIPRPGIMDDGFEVPHDAGVRITRMMMEPQRPNKNARPILDHHDGQPNDVKRHKWRRGYGRSNRGGGNRFYNKNN